MIRFAAVLLLLLLAPAASAKSAADCEKIQNPHEFNLCLASLSPAKPRITGSRPPRPGMARARSVRAGGAGIERRAGGRKRMSFDVR